MDKKMFWGYLHQNETIQVKRWFGDVKDYIDDCVNNPFIKQVVTPFEAKDAEEAYMIIERKLDGDITGS